MQNTSSKLLYTVAAYKTSKVYCLHMKIYNTLIMTNIKYKIIKTEKNETSKVLQVNGKI
jgi:hypothetical protein